MGDEAVLLAAGGRAILLQLAHPAVGHAVAEHSNFAADPTRRLRHTLTFVYALIWGKPGQAVFVTNMVNRAHAPVTGDGYDATDPELQLWVNATLYDSAIQMHTRVFGPLSDADADAIYSDYAEIGTALQMPHDLWPADRAAFERYWQATVDSLRVDDVTRGVAQSLLHPHNGPVWMRAAMPLVRLVTAGLLTPELRADFDLPWSRARESRFRWMMRATILLYPRLPRRLRTLPMRSLLRKVPDSTPMVRAPSSVRAGRAQ
jgi:uncharacterized protein (DUF2236 family)